MRRVAFCLAGQPRQGTNCFGNINQMIIAPTNADVFIHFWTNCSATFEEKLCYLLILSHYIGQSYGLFLKYLLQILHHLVQCEKKVGIFYGFPGGGIDFKYIQHIIVKSMNIGFDNRQPVKGEDGRDFEQQAFLVP